MPSTTFASTLSLVYAVAAALALTVAGAAWRRRADPGGRWLALFMAASAAWALGDIGELWEPTLEARLRWVGLQYPMASAVPSLLLLTVLALTRRERWLGRWGRAAVLAWPVVPSVLAWTNGQHQLLFAGASISTETGLTRLVPGPLLAPLFAVFYLLVAASVAVLLAAGRAARPRLRPTIGLLLVGVLVPWLASVASLLGPEPLAGVDWPPVALVLTGALMAAAVLGQDLLDPLPLARELAVEELPEGLLVLDRAGRLLDANPAARRLLGPDLAAVALGAWSDARGAGPSRAELRHATGSQVRWLELRTDPLLDGWGDLAGRIMRVLDVTEERTAEDERERLITTLEQTLAEVQALQGLLPICASCKKIRDARGYWNQVEAYLSSRSKVTFEQATCPGCAAARPAAEPGQGPEGGP